MAEDLTPGERRLLAEQIINEMVMKTFQKHNISVEALLEIILKLSGKIAHDLRVAEEVATDEHED